ncbi:hypothetical protein Tsubulata_034949 [Turnera subulata]|uniref:DUF4283 domain-containing protein n=1 Tax=Turnera subulata TaxID=218843 RepID=A0A9Q0GAP5_9ROSI|nr:hypothetical protein Tsubulata_034949 [Turnera subulata]
MAEHNIPTTYKEPRFKLEKNRDVGKKFTSLVLVGRLVMDRTLLLSVMQTVIPKIWKPKRHMEVSELKPNVFLFSFEAEQDKLQVLRNGPWSFHGHHLLLKEWGQS